MQRGGACAVCRPQMLLQVEQQGYQRGTRNEAVTDTLQANLVQGGN